MHSKICRGKQFIINKNVDSKIGDVVVFDSSQPVFELSVRDLCFRRFYPEGVVFNLAALTKSVRTGEMLKSCFHARFNEDLNLCPCACLEEYERRTSALRTLLPDQPNLLFLSLFKPFKPVSSTTIARWIKEILSLSGIDTAIFKAHSTRGASSTAAAHRGVSISDILQLGDWSQENTFQKFYYRPQFNTTVGRAILSGDQERNLQL